MILNKSTFNIVKRAKTTFTVAVDGFRSATTLIFRIRDRIRIAFVATLASQLYATILIKKVRLVISQAKLRVSITQTINLKRVSISYVFKQQMKFVSTIYGRLPIVAISKARQKIVSTIKNGILSVVAEPTLATFFNLGTYDPQTLGTLDVKTLGEMDYVSS